MSEIETPRRTRNTKPATQTMTTQDETVATDTQQFQPIVYASAMTYMHHLFKLGLSMFKKNIAIDEQQPEYQNTEHVHWFHSITSDGKPQDTCNSVGGHFHKMKVTHGPAGTAPIVTCDSGPLKYARKKNKYGQWERIIVPVNDVDTHTHDVQYIKSDKIAPRSAVSTEAAKVIGYFENKLAAPAEDVGGGKIKIG